MNHEHEIARDLLPLYLEGLTSPETGEFVEAHLCTCPKCRAELEALREPAPLPETDSPVPLNRLRRLVFRKEALAAAVALLFALVVALSAFAAATAPTPLPYSDDLMAFTVTAEGGLEITFHPSVDRAEGHMTTGEDGTSRVYQIQAFARPRKWFLPDSGQEVLTLSRVPDAIYYESHDGIAGDVLIYGRDNGSHSVSLPRLTLGYYVLLALAATAVLAGLRFCLRNKAPWRNGTEILLLLPVSYLLGHLLVKGTKTVTQSITRDFWLIVTAALLIYAALLFLRRLWKLRRKK